MLEKILAPLVFFAVLATLPPGAAAGKDPEPVECVRLARSWDDAVAEAKALNLPIVVHSHGFYCGPCWGMHSAVMCNKKYRKFSEANTVEVIVLSRLQEGIDKQDPRAATYTARRKGKEVSMLCELPGLTVEEALALPRTKAGQYNDTGGVPFTCVVDPHTLEEVKRFQGGTSAKTVMEAVEAAREQLEEDHGDGFSRKVLNDLRDDIDDAWDRVAKGDYAKAVSKLDKAGRKADDWPDYLRDRLTAARSEILVEAAHALDEIEALGATDRVQAKRRIRRLRAKLGGTGLEDRAAALYESLSA